MSSSFFKCGILAKTYCSLLMITFVTLKDISNYKSFSMLPRDISQLIFDDLVCSQSLTDSILEAFRDCALEVCFTALLE